MSEKREKRRRYNQRLEYIANFNKWLDTEPSILRLISWHRWKKSRPIFKKMDEEAKEDERKEKENILCEMHR